jgi:cytochrome c oxidase subunit IV
MEENRMYAKIYFATWIILLTLFTVLYLFDFLSDIGLVVFGFVFFGLLFMGLISVLPSSVHETLIKH